MTGYDTYVPVENAGVPIADGDKIEVFALQNSGQLVNMLMYSESNTLLIRRVR